MVKYACPDCGETMLNSMLTCMPPIRETWCPSCGAMFREVEPPTLPDNAVSELPSSYVRLEGAKYVPNTLSQTA